MKKKYILILLLISIIFSSQSNLAEDKIRENQYFNKENKNIQTSDFFGSISLLWLTEFQDLEEGVHPSLLKITDKYVVVRIINYTNCILSLLNRTNGNQIWNFTYEKYLYDVDASYNNIIVSSWSSWGGPLNPEIKVFNASNPIAITSIWNHSINVESQVKVSDDGSSIAVWQDSSTDLYLFNNTPSIVDKEPLWISNLSDTVNYVDISANGTFITASTKEKLFYFNKVSNSSLWNATSELEYEFTGLDMTSDGQFIAIGQRNATYPYDGGYLTLYNNDISEPKLPLWELQEDMAGVNKALINDDGTKFFYTTSYIPTEPYVTFYDDSLMEGWGYQEYGIYMEMSGSGEFMMAVVDSFYEVILWHESDPYPLWSNTSIENYDSLALTSDGRFFALGAEAFGKVYFYENSFRLVDIIYNGGGGNGDGSDDESNLFTKYQNLILIGSIVLLVILGVCAFFGFKLAKKRGF